MTALALAALLFWQFSSPLALQRAGLDHEIASRMRETVEASPLADPVEVSARFTRADVRGQSTLLGEVYAQRRPGVALADSVLRRRLARAVQEEVRAEWPHVTPLIQVSVFDPPGGRGRSGGVEEWRGRGVEEERGRATPRRRPLPSGTSLPSPSPYSPFADHHRYGRFR